MAFIYSKTETRLAIIKKTAKQNNNFLDKDDNAILFIVLARNTAIGSIRNTNAIAMLKSLFKRRLRTSRTKSNFPSTKPARGNAGTQAITDAQNPIIFEVKLTRGERIRKS